MWSGSPKNSPRPDPSKMQFGYVLAGEEHDAATLVKNGVSAERVGFDFLFVSDHFHPWSHQQGHSPAVWPVLGALAHATSKVRLVSAVCCPVVRWHPTTLAQSACTVAQMSGGRFMLGLGTGELLNEHVTGAPFPPYPERAARLAEAVEQIRELASGREVTREGRFFTTQRAQIFEAFPELPIAIAASGPKSAQLAGRLGDGLIGLADDPAVVESFVNSGGARKPRLTQLSVCWGHDRGKAEQLAHRLWPIVALEGNRFAELRTPSEVEKACQSVRVDEVAAAIVCGPDPQAYRQAIDSCLQAGYDGVAFHQIGPDQNGFLEFWSRELRPYYLKT